MALSQLVSLGLVLRKAVPAAGASVPSCAGLELFVQPVTLSAVAASKTLDLTEILFLTLLEYNWSHFSLGEACAEQIGDTG